MEDNNHYCRLEYKRLYDVWRDIMRRCYNEKERWKYPAYAGCSVYPEWHIFTNFLEWVKKQDYKGKQLDKDILIFRNKIYSPQTCVFIDKRLNLFLTENKRNKGAHPTGVDFHKNANKFRARCWSNDGTRKHIGLFNTAEEAYTAWKSYKHALACKLAEEQTDPRVAEALRRRYL